MTKAKTMYQVWDSKVTYAEWKDIALSDITPKMHIRKITLGKVEKRDDGVNAIFKMQTGENGKMELRQVN